MNGKVLVPLLKTVVFLDVMQVITPDNNGPGHLHLDDDASQDTTSDGDITSERTLLVNLGSVLSIQGNLESKTRILPVSGLQTLGWCLPVQVDVLLLLKCSLV